MAQEYVAGILPLARHVFSPVGILLTQVLCSPGQKAGYSIKNSNLLPFINFFKFSLNFRQHIYSASWIFFLFIYSICDICAAAFTKHCLSICNFLRYNQKLPGCFSCGKEANQQHWIIPARVWSKSMAHLFLRSK